MELYEYIYDQIYRIIGSKPLKYLKEGTVDLKAIFSDIINKTNYLMRLLLLSNGKTTWEVMRATLIQRTESLPLEPRCPCP